MRLGIVSDIHGNKIAFEAVLDDMPDVDSLICAGDVVGYNPWPVECVELVREECDVVVQGNHDRAVQNPIVYAGNTMAYKGLVLANNELSPTHMNWLKNLPKTEEIIEGEYLLVHSHPSPDSRGEYVTPDKFSELRRTMEVEFDDAYSGVILGHTHIQHAEQLDDVLIANPGSVGQPRDGDPRAAYGVLDLEKGKISLQRVEYDIDTVREEVSKLDLPPQTAERLYDGR